MEFIDYSRNLKILFESVCPVTPYSVFFLDFFPSVKGCDVLDYGFGSGVLSIHAALEDAKHVFGIERNELCLEIALKNSEINNTPHICFRIMDESGLSSNFQNTFDVILCNPASLPSNQSLPSFLDSGLYGVDMIMNLIKDSKRLLRDNGELFFIRTSLTPRTTIEDYLRACGFDFEISHSRTIPFREFYNPLLPYFEELRQMGVISFESRIDGQYYETLHLYRAFLR